MAEVKKKKKIDVDKALDQEESSPEQIHSYLEMAEKTFKESNPGLHDLMKRIQSKKNGTDQGSA